MPAALRLFAPLVAALLLADPASACGRESDCALESGRTYRIDGVERAGEGAIVFAHGYRGSAAGVMRNRSLRAVAERLGVAFIAFQSDGDDWKLPNAPGGKTSSPDGEMAYVGAVLDDAAARHGLRTDRLMMTGFSAGGMMTWTVMCHASERFAAFAPVAGTFWAPIPDACPAPAAGAIHIHGTSDPVVPIAGRRIADTAQGDVRAAIVMYGTDKGFAPAEPHDLGALSCERIENGEHGLSFCLHEGGHSLRAEWLENAWRRFEEEGRL